MTKMNFSTGILRTIRFSLSFVLFVMCFFLIGQTASAQNFNQPAPSKTPVTSYSNINWIAPGDAIVRLQTSVASLTALLPSAGVPADRNQQFIANQIQVYNAVIAALQSNPILTSRNVYETYVPQLKHGVPIGNNTDERIAGQIMKHFLRQLSN
jgi:hypothetical protein